MHCCLQEKKAFNKFYGLVIEKLIRDNVQSYRYSFKYTLWDYLKGIKNLELRQISNLAKLTAMLVLSQSIPIHFLKVIDFDSDQADDTKVLSSDQSVSVFLQIVFETLFEGVSVKNKEIIMNLFSTGIFQAGNPEFSQGISDYILTTFYSRVKKRYGQIPAELQAKLRVAFDAIKKQKENAFVENSLRER